MDVPFPERYHRAARSLDAAFGDLDAAARLDDERRLLLFALRQQAERGACAEPPPPLWRPRERHKHRAWRLLGDMPPCEAMVHFARLADAEVEKVSGGKGKEEEEKVSGGKGKEEEEKVSGGKEKEEEEKVSGGKEKEEALDEDIREHMEPTAENVLFLAREVMKLRRERRSRDHSPCAARGGASGFSLPSAKQMMNGAAMQVPPAKPNVFPKAEMPPPVRSNTAAVERAPKGWAEWFGFS